jgi:hypothetical protein
MMDHHRLAADGAVLSHGQQRPKHGGKSAGTDRVMVKGLVRLR